MSGTSERQGDNVIYEISDATGAVIDFRGMSRLTLAGLHAAQKWSAGVVFDTLVAFGGRTDNIMLALLSGFETLSSQGRRRFRVFRQEEEPLAASLTWLGARFLKKMTSIGTRSAVR